MRTSKQGVTLAPGPNIERLPMPRINGCRQLIDWRSQTRAKLASF